MPKFQRALTLKMIKVIHQVNGLIYPPFSIHFYKTAKGEEWAPPFISCGQDTVGLLPPPPLRLSGYGKPLPVVYPLSKFQVPNSNTFLRSFADVFKMTNNQWAITTENDRICSKGNQFIYLAFPLSWQSLKLLPKMFLRYLTDKISLRFFFQRGITPKMETTRRREKLCLSYIL